MASWLARLGPWWYALPSLVVGMIGLATCSLVDATDFDRYHVEASIAQRGNSRLAVVVRHWHADSGATVKCIWLLAGPAPQAGPSPKLAQSCVLQATDETASLRLSWQPNGRLLIRLPDDTTTSQAEPLDGRCYFERETLGRHVCYSPSYVDIARGP